MSLKQFNNSIRSILRNRHVNPVRGVAKHLQWQVRKAFDLFPCEQTISRSRIIARHKRCGVSALINNQGLYNFNNMNLIKMLLVDGGLFFDIGANIGSYTLVSSEQDRALVYSFEPHPATFGMLKENVELNRRDNVRLFNMALGIQAGEVFLSDDPGSAVNHIENKRGEKTIPVNCIRADSFCMENNLLPNHVKIDVEGFEYDVLAGFGEYLKSVDLFFVEVNGLSDIRSKGKAEIVRLLAENRFSGPFYFDFNSLTFTKQKIHQEDSIFLSKSFLEKTKLTVVDRP